MSSPAAQERAPFKGVVVANPSAAIPPMPAGFRLLEVDLPPNALHENPELPREQFMHACFRDKGSRVLSGLLSEPDHTHFMIADDDDMVSNRLAAWVAAHPDESGYVKDGYFWWEGEAHLRQNGAMWRYCGTTFPDPQGRLRPSCKPSGGTFRPVRRGLWQPPPHPRFPDGRSASR